MTSPIAGGVDCDLHPAVPHLTSLLPYLNDYWRDQVTTRGMVDLVSQSYPTHSPITSRPDTHPSSIACKVETVASGRAASFGSSHADGDDGDVAGVAAGVSRPESSGPAWLTIPALSNTLSAMAPRVSRAHSKTGTSCERTPTSFWRVSR